jgi:hypothetical protein
MRALKRLAAALPKCGEGNRENRQSMPLKAITAAQNGGGNVSRAQRQYKALAHSTIADLPGMGINQSRESEQSRDPNGAGDEECGQHDTSQPKT